MALLLFAGMIALSVVMIKRIPDSFLPPEDQGYLLGAVIMPDAASLDRTGDGLAARHRLFHEAAGGEQRHRRGWLQPARQPEQEQRAHFFVGFKSFDERYSPTITPMTQNARAVLLRTPTQKLSQVKEGIILPVNPPSIPGLGTTGGMEMWIQSKGDNDSQQIAEVIERFLAKARTRPELAESRRPSTRRPSTAGGRGPRQGRDTGGCSRGSIQHDADHVRLAVRIAVQQVRAGCGR